MIPSDVFARRVAAVRQALADVRAQSQDAWMAELTARQDPERELAVWEAIALAFGAFFDRRGPGGQARLQALRVLADCAAGRSELEIRATAYRALSAGDIRELIAHYRAAVAAADEIRQRRGVD
ncbi:hypothetical protein [Algiphilus sp.]|uniref:hypothetical protein n=1 Tax=Algiphilus sp. TaxID=1872431 RepID=UPI003C668662